MRRTRSLLTSRGARARGTSTAPITRSPRGRPSRARLALDTTVRPALRTGRRACGAGDVEVEDRDVGPEADRMAHGVRPDTPAPMTTTFPGRTPGTPPSRTPRPPAAASRALAPAWGASRPATSLIGASSGRVRRQPDGLVRRSRWCRRPSSASVHGSRRRQVEVGEQHLVAAEPVVLLLDRLLDLEHEIRGYATPRQRCRRCALPPRRSPHRDRTAETGRALDEHLVAGAGELVQPAGSGRRGTRGLTSGDTDLIPEDEDTDDEGQHIRRTFAIV